MPKTFYKFVVFNCMVCLGLSGCMSHGCVPENAPIQSYQKGQPQRSAALKRVVLIGGCFDVLHYGHMEFLQKAKAAGDYLIVALEPDETIVKYKKRVPIHTQQQRAENLAAIRYVDVVLLLPVMQGFKDYNQLVQDVRPDVIATTAGDPQMDNKKRQAEQIGTKIEVVIGPVGAFSTSNIIKALSD